MLDEVCDGTHHLGGFSFTSVNQVLNVLERVIIESTAVDIMDTHQESEAHEVFRDDSQTVDLSMMGEQLFESVVGTHSALELVHKFLVSIVTTVLFDTLVQVVHLDITGVNQTLASHRFNEKAVGVNVGVGHVLLNCGHVIRVTFEIGDRLINEVSAAKGLYWRALSQ